MCSYSIGIIFFHSLLLHITFNRDGKIMRIFYLFFISFSSFYREVILNFMEQTSHLSKKKKNQQQQTRINVCVSIDFNDKIILF